MKTLLLSLMAIFTLTACPNDKSDSPSCSVVQNERGNFFYVCDGTANARCWTEVQPGEYFVVTQDDQTFYCKQ